MRNFHPKTLVLIAVLITVTVVLVGVAIWISGAKKTGPAVTQQATPSPAVEKTALVYFSPDTLNLSQSTTPSASVDVYADSGKGSITGVQAEIEYDPTVITNVKVLPPDDTVSLFGPAGSYNTLFTDVATPGKLSFAVGILPSGTPAAGKGSVGKITFNVLKTKPSAELLFTKGTLVTSPETQESVLDYTIPLTIQLQSTTATSPAL